ncbi:nuclear transport factor 2 family protein [Spongiactinospora sp. TRM90649]|uniref:nuclear transport factor 2 family protein n=1 Tax=Spongiactinospora sp. TRM90649 TaxID=3031114 RepID=UPI0023F9162A|nr:nuclear transport factor 2 family protein [Spongiactinospora sp. TRM90649]MDF5752069.1 nuclear transport factor 2 family protein [Spongiactinospora sp. TRM90649]
MTRPAPADKTVQEWVAAWYRALDRHDDIETLWDYLTGDDLTFVFPEGPTHGHDDFRKWYETVTNRFFDEEHTVTSVDVGAWRDNAATLKVVVNWQARIWDPPAAKSVWIGFNAYQTWEVVVEPADHLRIRKYVVDSLDPMPGSPEL